MLSVMLLLANCSAINIPENNSFCHIYQPVYTAKADTEITKKEVDSNNLAYDCLCSHDLSTCKAAGI